MPYTRHIRIDKSADQTVARRKGPDLSAQLMRSGGGARETHHKCLSWCKKKEKTMKMIASNDNLGGGGLRIKHSFRRPSIASFSILIQYITKFRWLAIAVLILTPCFSFCATESKESVPPIIAPISLKSSGEIVNLHIKVVDHHVYYFSLRFSFREKEPEDRARVRLLTGGYERNKAGEPIDPGVPTPVLLVVARIDGEKRTEVYQKEIDPLLTSWGSDNFKKQIGFAELQPGIYSVRLILQRATSSFDGTPVDFSIGYDKFKVNFKPNK